MSGGISTRKRSRSPSTNNDSSIEVKTSTSKSSTDDDGVEGSVRRTFRQTILRRLFHRFIRAGGGKLWVIPRKKESASDEFVLWHMLAAPHEQIKRLVLADSKLYGGVREDDDGYLRFCRKETFWSVLGLRLHLLKYKDVEYWQLNESTTSIAVGKPSGMGLVSFDDEDRLVPFESEMGEQSKEMFAKYIKQLENYDFLEDVMCMVTATSSTSHLHMPQQRKKEAFVKETGSHYIFSVDRTKTRTHPERYLRIPQPRHRGLETDKEEQNLEERLGLHQHKLVKDMLACLIGCTASVEHTTALLKAGKLLVKHIKYLFPQNEDMLEVKKITPDETNALQVIVGLSINQMDKIRRCLKLMLGCQVMASREKCEVAGNNNFQPALTQANFFAVETESAAKSNEQEVLCVRADILPALRALLSQSQQAGLPILGRDERFCVNLQIDYGGSTTKLYMLVGSPGLERQGYSCFLGCYLGNDKYSHLAPFLKPFANQLKDLQENAIIFLHQKQAWDFCITPISTCAPGPGYTAQILPAALTIVTGPDCLRLVHNDTVLHHFKFLQRNVHIDSAVLMNIDIFLSSDLKGLMALSGRQGYASSCCVYCAKKRKDFQTFGNGTELTVEQLVGLNLSSTISPVTVPYAPLFPTLSLDRLVCTLHLRLGIGSYIFSQIISFFRRVMDVCIDTVPFMNEASLTQWEYDKANDKHEASILKLAKAKESLKCYHDSIQSYARAQGNVIEINSLLSKLAQEIVQQKAILIRCQGQQIVSIAYRAANNRLKVLQKDVQARNMQREEALLSVAKCETTKNDALKILRNLVNSSSSSSSGSNRSNIGSSGSSSSSSSSSTDVLLQYESVLSHLSEASKVTYANVLTAKAHYTASQNEVLAEQQANRAGPYLNSFIRVMKQFNVYSQVYFGGESHLNGNQVKNLLRRWGRIVPAVTEAIENLCASDTSLHRASTRNYTAAQVNAWSSFAQNVTPVINCVQTIFGIVETVALPTKNDLVLLRKQTALLHPLWVGLSWSVTPKVHVVTEHLAEFFERHRVHGIFSESFIELMHKQTNDIDRYVANSGTWFTDQSRTYKRMGRNNAPSTLEVVAGITETLPRRSSGDGNTRVSHTANQRPLRSIDDAAWSLTYASSSN